MYQDYRNPYLKKSKFQREYPASMSFSCTSLLGPTFSSCPRKHYSKNNWYDFKSSNPQLSEKAQFYKLQSLDYKQYGQYQHIDTCLLNNQCKKNPFQKHNLIDTNLLLKNNSATDSYSPHWTQQSQRNNFIDPRLQRNASDTMRSYKELRGKIAVASEKLLSANSLFDKSAMKMTFGEEKFNQSQQGLQRKQTLQSLGGRLDSKANLSDSKRQGYNQSADRLSKQSSQGTFGYRQTIQQTPKKLSWKGKQYFFIKFQPLEQ